MSPILWVLLSVTQFQIEDTSSCDCPNFEYNEAVSVALEELMSGAYESREEIIRAYGELDRLSDDLPMLVAQIVYYAQKGEEDGSWGSERSIFILSSAKKMQERVDAHELIAVILGCLKSWDDPLVRATGHTLLGLIEPAHSQKIFLSNAIAEYFESCLISDSEGVRILFDYLAQVSPPRALRYLTSQLSMEDAERSRVNRANGIFAQYYKERLDESVENRPLDPLDLVELRSFAAREDWWVKTFMAEAVRQVPVLRVKELIEPLRLIDDVRVRRSLQAMDLHEPDLYGRNLRWYDFLRNADSTP